MTERIRDSIIYAATQLEANLRSTADRLKRAIERRDFAALAELSLSSSTWSVDQVSGAALVIVRQEEPCGPWKLSK